MTKTNFTGLRFLFPQQAFLQIVVPELEARQIIEGFLQGTLKTNIGSSNAYGSWSVRVADIMALHTTPLESTQQTMGWRPGGSGI